MTKEEKQLELLKQKLESLERTVELMDSNFRLTAGFVHKAKGNIEHGRTTYKRALHTIGEIIDGVLNKEKNK